jgi:hypothetical protein
MLDVTVSVEFCMTTNRNMILVFTTIVLFFGVFFWSAERLNKLSEQEQWMKEKKIKKSTDRVHSF